MIPIQIIVAVAVAVTAFGAGYKVAGDSYAKQLADIHAEHTLALAAATENTRAIEVKWNRVVVESERMAATRIAALSRDLARTRSVADGLRNDLSASRSALPDASCHSVREHAATLNDVFGECAAAIEGLAGQASGHAIDTIKILESWPK